MSRSPDVPIDYLQPPLGYLVRIPCGDHAAGSPLDGPARDRAEQAAAFLRFERIGQIFCAGSSGADSAAINETAQIVWMTCTWDFIDFVHAAGPDSQEFLAALNEGRGLPCVLVANNADVQAALQRLGVSLPNLDGDSPGAEFANVRKTESGELVGRELVAPGGVISLHRDEEGQVVARARHMILDFAFTDFAEALTTKGTKEHQACVSEKEAPL